MATPKPIVWEVPLAQFATVCELVKLAHDAGAAGDEQRLSSLVDRLRRMGYPRHAAKGATVHIVPKNARIWSRWGRKPISEIDTVVN